MSNVANDRLNGWKEIATYLGRDERTAKRWEKQRGLPVRRIPGGGRSNVYILISELEAWLSADPPASVPIAVAPALLEQPEEPPDQPESASPPPDPPDRTVPAPSLIPPPVTPVLQRDGLGSKLSFVTLCLLLLGGTVGASLARHRLAAKKSGPPPSAAATHRPAPYHSLEAGLDQRYLLSLYLIEQRTPDALQQARSNLLEVTTRDPQHAPAFAQLANTYLLLREFSSVPDAEAYAEAEHAASHALRLDPTLPEAHAALGYINFFSAANPGSAANHFDEALRLDPSCALAHFWYGSLLTHQGRFPEALEHLDRAQQLQPTSAAIQASRAFALGLSGQRDEAIRLLHALLQADPNAPAPHRSLARLSLLEPRDLDLYLDEMQKFAQLRQSPEQQRALAAARLALHRGGEQAMWRSILASERGARPPAGGPTYGMAQAELQLGHSETSLRDLEQLCAAHDSQMMNLIIDPLFFPLRQNSRFHAILDQVGLPSVSRPISPASPS